MTPPGKAAIRSVHADLRAASDAKLAEVIAMVDALAERGEADRLVAPLRPRLAALRPPRPLRFARLLFLPLDPVIVDTARWRVDSATIPRGAIPPLAGAVLAALGDAGMGDVGRDVTVMIAGQTTASAQTVLRAGSILWPLAARALAGLERPVDWSRSGLPSAAFGPIAATVAALLRPADKVAALRDGLARGMVLDQDLLGAVLRDTAGQGPAAWQAVTSLLLLQLPEPGLVLRAIAGAIRGGDPALRVAGEKAADAALRQLGTMAESGGLLRAAGGADGADAALAELARTGDLLAALDENGAGPERRQLIGQVRGHVSQACRDWTQARLHDVLQSPAAPGGDDAAVEAREYAARGLRAVETVGRRFGGAEHFDRMLRAAGDELARMATGPGFSAADRARMMELLAGPDAAIELLRQEARGREAARTDA